MSPRRPELEVPLLGESSFLARCTEMKVFGQVHWNESFWPGAMKWISYQLARYTDMKELWPGALKWKNYGQVHWNERFWSWSCWCIFLFYCLMGISKIELDKYIWVRNCNRGLLCILCNYMSLRPRKLSFVVLLFQGALEGSTGIRLLSKWKKRQCRGTFLFNEEIQKILPFRATRPFDEWNISQYAAFKYLFKD